MKNRIIFILLAVICISACQKNENGPDTDGEHPVIGAMNSFFGKIAQDTLDVKWQKGDQVVAFVRNTVPKKYQIEDEAEGSQRGIFNIVNESKAVQGDDGNKISDLVCFYPYSDLTIKSTAEGEGNYLLDGIEIPSVQKYNPQNIISQYTLPMVSVTSDDGNISTFKNLCGVLELKLTGRAKVDKIILKSINGEKISGPATLTLKNLEAPVLNMKEDASDQIVLDCSSQELVLDENNPTTFRFVVPAVALSNGFEITIDKGDPFSTMIRRFPRANEIKRSEILSVPAFDFFPSTYVNPKLTYEVNGVSFNMIGVKGGAFEMGATPEQLYPDGDESPVHLVYLTNYYIGETEVTQELWEAVMGNNPSDHQGNPQYPVEHVTWYEFKNFLAKLNEILGKEFKFPTEAQWEYAARGGCMSCGYQFSGANFDEVDSVSWHMDNTDLETHPVAQKRPNELGIYDMSGNVWEWCSDIYQNDYYYHSPKVDPKGPDSFEDEDHVLRGGSFMDLSLGLRVANRDSYCPYVGPSFIQDHRGFRLVLHQ